MDQARTVRSDPDHKKDATDTVTRIAQDTERGSLNEPVAGQDDADAIAAWLTERVPDHVTWAATDGQSRGSAAQGIGSIARWPPSTGITAPVV